MHWWERTKAQNNEGCRESENCHVKNTWEETKINALDKMYLCTKFDHNDSIIRRVQRFGS